MQKGFTLIELLVVIAVLALLSVAISGIFASVLQQQRLGLANQELMDKTSYTLEYISRSFRMAIKQTAELPSCLSQIGLNYEITRSGQGIKFINYQGICYEFYLEGDRLFQKKDVEILPLTSTNLEVLSFKLNLLGSSDSDNLQPRLTFSIKVKGKGLKPEQRPEFKIQTTISQRELDIR